MFIVFGMFIFIFSGICSFFWEMFILYVLRYVHLICTYNMYMGKHTYHDRCTLVLGCSFRCRCSFSQMFIFFDMYIFFYMYISYVHFGNQGSSRDDKGTQQKETTRANKCDPTPTGIASYIVRPQMCSCNNNNDNNSSISEAGIIKCSNFDRIKQHIHGHVLKDLAVFALFFLSQVFGAF